MKIFYVIIILIFNSCAYPDYSLTYYNCNGVFVTRVSDNAWSKFYYGKITKDSIPGEENYIKSEYAGFNNDMEIYLIFKGNKEVELVHLSGEYLSYVGTHNKSFYFSNFDNEVFKSKLKLELEDSDCSMRIFDNIDREKKWATDNQTNVLVEYK